MYTILDDDAATETVASAYAGGITLFDTSPFYGHGLSEQRFGAVLAPQAARQLRSVHKGRDDTCCLQLRISLSIARLSRAASNSTTSSITRARAHSVRLIKAWRASEFRQSTALLSTMLTFGHTEAAQFTKKSSRRRWTDVTASLTTCGLRRSYRRLGSA